MTTRGPAEPTCEGVEAGDGGPSHIEHCPGCAEAATLRERLEAAEREAAGLRWAECGECEWFGPQGALVLEKSLISHCPVCFCTATLEAQPIDLALRRITNLKARATAAERERDEWEGRWLERGDNLKLAEGELARYVEMYDIRGHALRAAEGERDRLRARAETAEAWARIMLHAYEHDTRPPAGTCLGIRALAAIPHAEGEASAPPADEVKRG